MGQPRAVEDLLVVGCINTSVLPLALQLGLLLYDPLPTHAWSTYICVGSATTLLVPFRSSTILGRTCTFSFSALSRSCSCSSAAFASCCTCPNPIPRVTIASSLAYSKCFLTSCAAFFLLNRICTIASSIGFPAICLASGKSFLTDVLMNGLFDSDCRSVCIILSVLLSLPLLLILRITIFLSHLIRDCGIGSSSAAITMGSRFTPPVVVVREVVSIVPGTRSSSSSMMEPGASSPGFGGFGGGIGLRLRKSGEDGSRIPGDCFSCACPRRKRRSKNEALRFWRER